MHTEHNNLTNCTKGFGLALAAASVLNALLVVAKEKSPAVQSALQHLTGHHWISHSAIVLVAFIVAGLALRGRMDLSADGLITTIVSGVIASTVIIVGFYLIAG